MQLCYYYLYFLHQERLVILQYFINIFPANYVIDIKINHKNETNCCNMILQKESSVIQKFLNPKIVNLINDWLLILGIISKFL